MVECQLPKLKVAGSTPVSRSTSTDAAGMRTRTPAHGPPPARRLVSGFDIPEGLTSIGHTIAIRGEVTSGEHLIIEGRVDGRISAPNHGVAIARRARVTADISARTITVKGSVRGTLVASGTIDVEAGSVVEGHVEAEHLRLAHGASVDLLNSRGQVMQAAVDLETEPQHRRVGG